MWFLVGRFSVLFFVSPKTKNDRQLAARHGKLPIAS